MGCGASHDLQNVPAVATHAATDDKTLHEKMEDLGHQLDRMADVLVASASTGALQHYYEISPLTLGTGTYSTVQEAVDRTTGEKWAIKSITLKYTTRDSMKRARRRSGTHEEDSGESDGAALTLARAARRSSCNDSEAPRPTNQLKRVWSSAALELRQICREIDILKNFKHDSIVTLHEYFISPSLSRIQIVLELLPGGDLLDALHDRTNLDEGDARTVSQRVLSGLEYLHARGCVHRDLKFENLMLKRVGDFSSVKIVDFGFARRLLEGDVPDGVQLAPGTETRESKALRKFTFCGTPNFMAPEVIGLARGRNHLESSDGYDAAADMWSFGVVLWRMLTGTMPFDAATQAELYSLIRIGELYMDGEEWATISTAAKNLVGRLLSVRAKDRPTAAAALKDPWIRGNEAAAATTSSEGFGPALRSRLSAMLTGPSAPDLAPARSWSSGGTSSGPWSVKYRGFVDGDGEDGADVPEAHRPLEATLRRFFSRERVELVRVPRGQSVIREGEQSQFVFLLWSGLVHVRATDLDWNTLSGTAQPGHFLGHLPLLSDQSYVLENLSLFMPRARQSQASLKTASSRTSAGTAPTAAEDDARRHSGQVTSSRVPDVTFQSTGHESPAAFPVSYTAGSAEVQLLRIHRADFTEFLDNAQWSKSIGAGVLPMEMPPLDLFESMISRAREQAAMARAETAMADTDSVWDTMKKLLPLAPASSKRSSFWRASADGRSGQGVSVWSKMSRNRVQPLAAVS